MHPWQDADEEADVDECGHKGVSADQLQVGGRAVGRGDSSK